MTSIRISKSAPPRLEFIDASRAIAALMVMFLHEMQNSIRFVADKAESVFSMGLAGVLLFFLVSGFVISMTLDRTKTVKAFWTSRFFRLYPLYWISLIVAILIQYYFPNTRHENLRENFWQSSLFNISMIQELFKIPNVIEPYWTLGFEMLFYGIATAFFAARRSQNLHFCLIPLIIILTFSGFAGIVLHRDLGFFRVMLLTFFFSGSMLYRMGVSQTIKAERIWLGASVSAIVFAWIGSQFVPNGARSVPELLAILFAFVSFYFLRSVSMLQFPKWLLFIGKISYSLYLIHAIVGYAVFAVASQLNPWIRFVILMVLPIPLSALSYKYIEEPMVAIAKKLVKKQQSA